MEEREHRSVSEKIMVNGRVLEDINLNYNKTPEGRSLIGNINKLPVFVRFPPTQQEKQQTRQQKKQQERQQEKQKKRKTTLNAKRKAKRDSTRKANRKANRKPTNNRLYNNPLTI